MNAKRIALEEKVYFLLILQKLAMECDIREREIQHQQQKAKEELKIKSSEARGTYITQLISQGIVKQEDILKYLDMAGL